MILTTWNLNGLNSALKNGLAAHVRELRPDVLMLQETKAPAELIERFAETVKMHATYDIGARPGYAGVAILTSERHEPLVACLGRTETERVLLDQEGRLSGAHLGGVDYLSVYVPSGSKKERLAIKHLFLTRLIEHLTRTDNPTVIAGDLNVAHTALDLELGLKKKRVVGALPEERALLDRLHAIGFRDLVREAQGNIRGPFTWRSRTQGWRIDHVWTNAKVRVKEVSLGAGKPVSDHHALNVQLGAPGEVL